MEQPVKTDTGWECNGITWRNNGMLWQGDKDGQAVYMGFYTETTGMSVTQVLSGNSMWFASPNMAMVKLS